MRVIAFRTLREYAEKHADAYIPLSEWYRKTSKSQWHSLADIRRTFNSVDYAGNKRYVFNIKGNKYRIVAMVLFEIQQVYIRFVGSHREYEKIDCSKI